ncbi:MULTISPECIES: Eco57I restriction-modification methylase domain-containing protein [unclassified Collinsella]|uniref:Eco57I restriction-modification methylase domain-containing protein n=1 Tax=unclassified Collinsella TaxID=2637548 RepID=UPI003F8C3B8D
MVDIDLNRLMEMCLRGDVANHHISSMYSTLSKEGLDSELISGWLFGFRYIYGDSTSNLSSNGKLDASSILSRYSIDNSEEPCLELLFLSIQTYYSLFLTTVTAASLYEANEHDLQKVFDGSFFKGKGLDNYGNHEWYKWISKFTGLAAEVQGSIYGAIQECRTADRKLPYSPSEISSFLVSIYEAIVPHELRHALGEFNTPYWLAQKITDEVLEVSDKGIASRVLDPTCGAGTFLLAAIQAKRDTGIPGDDILDQICGIDINPISVLTAKTSILFTFSENVELVSHIPIYCTDVISFGICEAESEYKDDNKLLASYMSCLPDYFTAKNEINKVDCVIGNPPWVNWEYLSEDYRNASAHIWKEYGLFDSKGRDKSFSKEDISSLITYVSIDAFLENGGILGFVLRQATFKSEKNSVHFRSFRSNRGFCFCPIVVDDYSSFRAFPNANTCAVTLIARKGQQAEYPVKYNVWTRAKRGVGASPSLKKELYARPVTEDPRSIWIIGKPERLGLYSKILGKNDYVARTGVFTGGANAVYWLNIIQSDEESVTIRNQTERAKRSVPRVESTIEKGCVYPLLKGSGLGKWAYQYDSYILCPHNNVTKMKPLPYEVMSSMYPKTLDYLTGFRSALDARRGFAGWEKEVQKNTFYAILRIGDYSFAPYKVCWRYIATEFICSVVEDALDPHLGNTTILPNEKIMYVGLNDEMEAYYLCGVLTSSIISECINSYMNPTSISAHVLGKLSIESFDKNNPLHIAIAENCKHGHKSKDKEMYAEENNRLVEELVMYSSASSKGQLRLL